MNFPPIFLIYFTSFLISTAFATSYGGSNASGTMGDSVTNLESSEQRSPRMFFHTKTKEHDRTLPRQATFSSLTAEKLIRSFNLTPMDAKADNGKFDLKSKFESNIVEKKIHLLDIWNESSVHDLGHHAGYFKLSHSFDARLFYFFFESREKKGDPVVIWLTGGPGCGSEIALFYENGPYHISKDLSLQLNSFGWDQASNLIYVDQPTGTGFSYSSDKRDIRHDEDGVSNDLYDFMQAFFIKHPEYSNNDFYITGESYAGHYIPAFASRVNKGNNAKEGTHINLKGFAIGNGLTDPEIQYKAYTDYALQNKLIDESDYESINQLYPDCQQAAKQCGESGTGCRDARKLCLEIYHSILNIAGNINVYDIRKQCIGSLCYDFSNMERFLGLKSVRESLGVGDIEFDTCSPTVYNAMIDDWMRNLEVGIPALLEDGIKMLIYAGEYDLICNWLGNSIWVEAMQWSGQKDYVAAPNVDFIVDGAKAGELKKHGQLSFLKVHDAGHMVPMDQPKAALEMIQRWIQDKLG